MAKKKRPSPDDDDADVPGVSSCLLCGGDGQGHVYEFWTGKKEHTRETATFTERRVKTTYSDFKQIRSFVCDRCAAAARRKAYRMRLIGWGVVAALGLVLLLVVLVSGIDKTSQFICGGVFGVLAVPTGGLALFYAWQSFGPVPRNDATDRLVLAEVRLKRPHKRGYDYFTEADYENHFNRDDD